MTALEAIRFIRENKRYGDRKAICEQAGVSRQTFDTMLRHEKGPDEEKWLDAEYRVLVEAVQYLKIKVAERRKMHEELEVKLSEI